MLELIILLAIIAIAVLLIKYLELRRELSLRVEMLAIKMFEEWKTAYEGRVQEWKTAYEERVREEAIKMIEEWKRVYEERVKESATKIFQEWKIAYEEKIREDAIKKSISTILGRVGEQLAPLLLFTNYGISPKDLRFLGTPVDYIAFKGLGDEKLEEIIFIEVKSGKTTRLGQSEKMVEEVVKSGKIRWLLINMQEEIDKIRDLMQETQA